MIIDPNIPALERAYNSWTNANIALLIIAGITAALVAVASFVGNRRSAALIKAKDNQLAISLKEKDEQIASLENQNLVLRTDLVNLQNRVKWRQIREEQKTQLIADLRAAPKANVRVTYVGSERDEPYLFTKQIIDALKAANWSVGLSQPIAPDKPSAFCVIIPGAHHVAQANALVKAFVRAGFPVDLHGGPYWPEHGVWIHVGDRLQP